jgi:hypothetical protein
MAIFDGDRDEAAAYLRTLADHMGLRDWTINLLNEHPGDERYAASVEVRYGRKYANIRLGKGWEHESPESFRVTCVHELLHCHTKPMQWAFENTEVLLGTSVYHVARLAYRDAEEVAVDAIASEWANTLPLPAKSDLANPSMSSEKS